MLERARNTIRDIQSRLRGYFATSPVGLKEHIHGRNGDLIASSHPDEINQIIDKRKVTLKAQKDRKNRPASEPLFKTEPGEEAGTTEILFTYKGHEYSFTSKVGVTNIPVFINKLKEYLPNAPECTTCDRVFFPGESVAEDSKGLMHLTFDCCPAGILFSGRIGADGKAVQPETRVEKGQYINKMTFHYTDDDEIAKFYNS